MNKKNTILLVACILGIVVVAGAAYLAIRLINHPQSAGAPLAAAGKAAPDGKRMAAQGPTVIPSDLVPQRDPNVTGQVTTIKDNSIFVSVVVLEGVMDPNSQNLPPTEVVVTKDTKILKSVGTETITDSSGNQVEKKKEEEVTINALGTNYIVNVWGEKRGDRYYADVITYIEM